MEETFVKSRLRLALAVIVVLVAVIAVGELLSNCGDEVVCPDDRAREEPVPGAPPGPTAESVATGKAPAPEAPDQEPVPDPVAVEVILLDGVTGHHLPGGEVILTPHGGAPVTMLPVGDRYRLDAVTLPRGPDVLVALRVRPPEGQALEAIGPTQEFWLTVSPKARVLEITVVTRPEIVWRIRVLDVEKREPVAGAKLTEFSLLGSKGEITAPPSDVEGWMTVRGIPDLRGQFIFATVVEGERQDNLFEKIPKRGARFESRAILEPIRPPKDPPLSLGGGSIGLGGGKTPPPPPPPKTPTYRTGPVLVTVRDRAGKPVPFAALFVIDPDGPEHLHLEGDVQRVGIRADVEGKRVLPDLPEGPLRIRAEYGTRSAEAEVAEDGTVDLVLR